MGQGVNLGTDARPQALLRSSQPSLVHSYAEISVHPFGSSTLPSFSENLNYLPLTLAIHSKFERIWSSPACLTAPSCSARRRPILALMSASVKTGTRAPFAERALHL